MTSGRVCTISALVLALAGCGAEGGELREETERRRAAGVEVEEPAPDTARPAEPAPDRLPAFVLDDSAAPAPVSADSAPNGAAPPESPAGAAWTAGRVDVVRSQPGAVTLLDLRAGVNDGFDRVVMEFTGPAAPGHRVEYVDRPVRECGSGRTVAMAGDGWLAITLRGTRAHTEAGRATVERRNRRVDMPVLRQIVVTCDFEGVVQIVLGVDSPNEFRVTELSDPARLIVDVHQ
jgi:hypothetical protein